MKILVLEQNSNIRDIMIDMLSLQGNNIFNAETLNDAVSIFNANNIDLIILDSGFCNNAIEVISKIREISNKPKFILLTEFGNEKIIEKARQYGITEVIPKETSTDLLLKILTKIIKKIEQSGISTNEITERKPKILVVDDSELIRKILQDFLEERQYIVLLANNGQEAMCLLKKDVPDLMLLDITMPVMDGIEVLKEMKKLDINLPVIMITTNTDIQIARETLNIGAYDYIAKPINFEYLETSILAKVLHKTYE